MSMIDRPPLDDIGEALEAYFHLGFNDKQLEAYLRDHYGTESYELCTKLIRCYRKELGLLSTRQQKHTSESIASAIAENYDMFLSHGAWRETIRKELAMRYGIRATHAVVLRHLHETEPDAVKARHVHCFHAAGVNDIWVQDQHDKWDLGSASGCTTMTHLRDTTSFLRGLLSDWDAVLSLFSLSLDIS
ncbi:hypothetical protein BYT27DRAFT_7342820 [Phlegmacium glaucopus]|nr:hypothetical protein BYT27DRAFT_7342820 [Phlegmacium glaucopus]